MASNRERFDQRSMLQRKLGGQPQQCFRGDGPGTLKCSRRVDTHEVQVLADVAMSGGAGRTVAAGVEGHNRDAVAQLPLGDSGASLGDGPRHLVPEDRRHLDSLIHGAMENVQIGAANSAMRHIDSYFTSARDHRAALAKVNRSISRVECCLHIRLSLLPAICPRRHLTRAGSPAAAMMTAKQAAGRQCRCA